MASSKCLATLYWLITLPTRKPISSWPASLPRVHAGLDLLEVGLGGREQFLALVRAQLGELRIAARHQALAGIVRRAQLEQVALVEQAQLQMALLDQRADRDALQRA